MKFNHKPLLIFIILISFIFNSSCNETKLVKKSEVGKKELTIYYCFEKKVSDFNHDYALGSYDGIKINPVYFDQDLEKLQNQLNVELMVGEGPDVICTEDYSFDIIKSVYKLATSNILIDLNPYIKVDKTYKPSDYNNVIMNSGIYNGKRFFLPRLYNIPLLTSTKKKLEANNINISGNSWSWEDMISTCKNFINSRKDKHQALIFDKRNELIINLISNSKTKFIDYSSKVTKFNTQNFISLLKDYKNYIYQVTLKDTESNENALLADDNLVVMRNNPEGMGDSLTYLDTTRAQNNDEAYLLPSYGNGGIYGVPREMYGITSKCKYKQAAYDFIQNNVKSTNIDITKVWINGAAVYKPLSDRSMEVAEGKKPFIPQAGIYINRILNSDEKNIFDKISNVSEFRLNDNTVNDMITSTVDKYIKGSITAEQAASELDRKVKLFLNE